MSAIGSFGGNVTATTVSAATTGKVENATISIANTEQSHTFPANTKSFLIQARGNGKIKLSFDSGTSGTIFWTIPNGTYYGSPEFSSPSLTIYFQSPVTGLVVELISWS